LGVWAIRDRVCVVDYPHCASVKWEVVSMETAAHMITMDDAKVIALLVTSVGGVLISLIGAIAAGVAVIRTGKIHTLVNSALDAEKMKVAMRDALLLAKDLEIASAEKARLALAATPTMSVPVTVETTPPSVIITPGEMPR